MPQPGQILSLEDLLNTSPQDAGPDPGVATLPQPGQIFKTEDLLQMPPMEAPQVDQQLPSNPMPGLPQPIRPLSEIMRDQPEPVNFDAIPTTPYDLGKYHESLPYPMTADVAGDEQLYSQFEQLNEMATGKLGLTRRVKLDQMRKAYEQEKRPDKKRKLLVELQVEQRLADNHLADIQKQAAEAQSLGLRPDEYMAKKQAEHEGTNILPLEMAQGFGQGLTEGTASTINTLLGRREVVRRQNIKNQWRETVELLKDTKSPIGGFMRGAFRKTAQTLGQMFPALAAGAATKNPYAVYTLMGGQAGVDAFGQARDKGWGWAESAAYGAVSGAIETFSEYLGGKVGARFGLETLQEAVSNPGVKSLVKGIAGSAIEGGEELYAEILHNAVDIVTNMDPDAVSHSNYPETFTVGFLAGGFGHVQSYTAYMLSPTQENAEAAGIPEEYAKDKQFREKTAEQAHQEVKKQAIRPRNTAADLEGIAQEVLNGPEIEARVRNIGKHYGYDNKSFDNLIASLRPETEDEWGNVVDIMRDEARGRVAESTVESTAKSTGEAPVVTPEPPSSTAGQPNSSPAAQRRQAVRDSKKRYGRIQEVQSLKPGDRVLVERNGKSIRSKFSSFNPDTNEVEVVPLDVRYGKRKMTVGIDDYRNRIDVRNPPKSTQVEQQQAEPTQEQPAEAAIQQPAKHPTTKANTLGEHFGQKLTDGETISSIADARKIAAEFTGKKAMPGTKDAKAVDEAVEQGVVRAARQIISQKESPEKTFSALVDLYNRQPNLVVRTSTSMQQQAYSTPAPLAYIAQHMVGVEQNTKSLDSSAGNGMLLTATVNGVGNEINEQRANSLREQGIRTTQEDATAWDPGEKFDTIVINPPFGTVEEDGKKKVWQVAGIKTDQVDHAIALRTLETASKPNTKTAIILGSKGFEAGDPKADIKRASAYSNQKAFYDALYDKYNVVDHFTVSGDLYSRQGAKFPVDVIVINGEGKSNRPRPWNFKNGGLPAVYNTWEDLGNAKLNVDLDALSSHFTPDTGEREDGDVGGVPKSAPKEDQGPRTDNTGSGSTENGGAGVGRPGRKPTVNQPGSRSGKPGRVPGDTERNRGPKSGPVSDEGESAGSDRGSTGTTGSGGLAKPGAVNQDELNQAADDLLDELLGTQKKQPPKIQPKQKPGISQKAAEARQQAKDSAKALIDALKKKNTSTSTGVDPDLLDLAVKAAVDSVRAGAYTFAEYVAIFSEQAPHMLAELKPYLETAWERLRQRDPTGGKMGPTGTVEIDQKQPKPIELKPQEEETEFQVAYKPRSQAGEVGTLLPINQAAAVERALDNIETHHGNIDEFVARELGYKPKELGKYFSAEQVDAIAMAVANDKVGEAFILADQTGVGKGRVVAAMMKYAIQQGKVPIFFTEKPSLYGDIMRDLTAIGMNEKGGEFNPLITNPLIGMDKVDLNAATPSADPRIVTQGAAIARRMAEEALKNYQAGEGLKATKGRKPIKFDAIFTTYSQTNPVNNEYTWRHRFLNKVMPDAYLILDESHNALGSGQADQQDPDDEKLRRSDYLREIVNAAGNVMYSSATFAKRPEVMDLYSRAGIRDAIQDQDKLRRIVSAGIPMQQAISEMLVEAGLMLRRERSFHGVDFKPKAVTVGTEAPDKTSEIFRSINAFSHYASAAAGTVEEDIVSSGGKLGDDNSTGTAGVDSTNFTSILWNLTDQMLTSMKADEVANEAIASAKRGERPVIVVDNTMETALDRFVEENGSKFDNPIAFGFRDYLKHYLERTREILIKHDRTDPNSWERVRLTDEELGPAGVHAYNEALGLINKFDQKMPASPIDWMRYRMQAAGLKVAEITGRESMIEYDSDNVERGTLVKRPSEELGNEGKNRTVSSFNDGSLDAIIINRSGSTGLSIHASETFADTRQRHMIIAQAAKNIDEFMQALGRVHRTGQVTKPKYTLFMTDAPAENRPASILLKKLKSLNANVTGSASGNVSFDVPNIINVIGDYVVARWMEEHQDLNRELGSPARYNSEGKITEARDLSKKVSGRVVLLPIEQQQEFWNEIVDLFSERLAQLDAAHQNPLVAPLLDLDARTIERILIAGEESENIRSPFQQPAYIERIDAKKIGKPMLPQEIEEAVKGFYGVDKIKLLKAAREWHARTVAESQEAARKYWDKEFGRQNNAIQEKFKDDPAGLQVAMDQQRAKEVRIRGQMQDQLNSISRTTAMLHPGQTVRYQPLGDGIIEGSISGIVIGIHPPRSGNPAAPSRWSVDIALADAQRRVRINLASGLSLVSPDSRENMRDMFPEFEEAGAVGREERYIATGNILAAAEQMSHEKQRPSVVFFKDHNGDTRRGILTNKNFNPQRWIANRPAVFKAAKDVHRFLREGGRAQTADGSLLITYAAGSLVATAPKARSRGGKYTTSDKILAASSPDEFVSVGTRMELAVKDQARQEATLQAIMEVGGIQANSDRELARRLASEGKIELVEPYIPSQQEQSEESGGGGNGPQLSQALRDDKKKGPTPIPPANPTINQATREIKAELPVPTGEMNRTVKAVLQIVAPAATSKQAEQAAIIMRGAFAETAQKRVAMYRALEGYINAFYGKLTREQVVDFVDNLEHGRDQKNGMLNEVARILRHFADKDTAEIQKLGLLQEANEHWFGHLWKKRDQKKAEAMIVARRPFEGSKGFLKKRKYPYFKDGIKGIRDQNGDLIPGLEGGLEPKTWNPIEMALLKHDEMQKFIQANNIIERLREKNLVRFVYAKSKTPSGYSVPTDGNGPSAFFTVFGPPTVETEAYYDSVLAHQLIDFARSIGVSHERLMKLGRSRHLGEAYQDKRIKTKFGTPVGVLAHEIGHQLGFAYDLETMLIENEKDPKTRVALRDEWRKLADLRLEDQKEPSGSRKRYVRKKEEKEAVLLEAFISAKEKFRAAAPNLFKKFKKFLNDSPQLRPLLDMNPSLTYKKETGEVEVPGRTTLGHYAVPNDVALLINNYLSGGWYDNKNDLIRSGFQAYMDAGNTLNMTQLGFSGFHAMFTAMSIGPSLMGQGMRNLSTTKPSLWVRGVQQVGKSFVPGGAAVETFFAGKKLAKAMRHELENISDPELQFMARAALVAGMRSDAEKYYLNNAEAHMRRAIEQLVNDPDIKKKTSAMFTVLPGALGASIQKVMSPIFEYQVPYLKLGMFTWMAKDEMERLGTTDLSDENLQRNLTKIADSIDNRLGMMVYDNIFWNKFLKDSMFASTRAVGWNWGFFREYVFGAAKDTAVTPKRISEGDALISWRMGEVVGTVMQTALIGAAVGYLFTGDRPKELLDYFFPKTGRDRPDGSPERIVIPTYMKDVVAWSTQPITTARHKAHPLLSLILDTLANKDYYGTEIHEPIDSVDDLFKYSTWKDTLTYIGKAYQPFSFRNWQEMRKSGASGWKPAVTAFAGIGEAPSYITRDAAHKLMAQQLAENARAGNKTQADADRYYLRRQSIQQLREGKKLDLKELSKTFNAESIKRIEEEAKQDPIVVGFNRLRPTQALDVFLIQKDSDRKKTAGMMLGKFLGFQADVTDYRQDEWDIMSQYMDRLWPVIAKYAKPDEIQEKLTKATRVAVNQLEHPTQQKEETDEAYQRRLDDYNVWQSRLASWVAKHADTPIIRDAVNQAKRKGLRQHIGETNGEFRKRYAEWEKTWNQ